MATSVSPPRDRRRGTVRALALGALLLTACWAAPGRAEEPNPFAPDQPAADGDQAADAEGSESGVLLPADRGKDRLLDRARRLVADGRWTDAAAALDEVIADDRDAFAGEVGTAATTRRSVRTEAARMIQSLPRPGQEAYGLLFRARAEKALADAVAADDGRAIRSVARRWFATPAGRSAALMAAIDALEANQPHEAGAWLDRLATAADARDLDPTLSLMRALARQRGGEPDAAAGLLEAVRDGRGGAARIAGRDVTVTFDGGEALAWLGRCVGAGAAAGPPASGWRQPRGDPARNALVTASRPLLVPRYRVPLARHPQESRLLDKRRQAAADAGQPLLPAGTPLAIGDTVVLRTALGILGIDFATGKRLWLQSAIPAADDAGRSHDGLDAALGRVFDDATSAGLSSDGRLVFAVESHPDALSPRAHTGFGFDLRGLPRADGGWRGGNTLSAYDTAARGAMRWRLPATDAAGPAATSWYLGAPLVVGTELYALVEAAGEVRLDVLDAGRGEVLWSQPLAALDEQRTVDQPAAVGRRRAGLTPAYADGVLVCPLGAGTVVALDIATRSLLWAHHYPRDDAPAEAELPLRDAAADEARRARVRRGDPCPVIAGGQVLLTPDDSAHLICLGLRDGSAAWPPRAGGLRLAGVAADRVIVVGPQGVEALAADTGQRLWQRPFAAGTRPSGRGILTATSLFLPLDTPEVIEIRLADGGVAARCPARGGAVPGNLLAHRGEILSRGVDTLDVFHQEAALEARIETAQRAAPDDAWAATWRAHVEVAGGDVAKGLRALYAASGAQRPARQTLRDATIHALDRDFAASVVVWRELATRGEPIARAPEVVRMAVDGCLRAGDLAGAWEGCLTLLREPAATDLRPFADPTSAALEVTGDRWLRGRLHELRGRAAGPLRDEIDRAIAGLVAAAAAVAPDQRVAGLATLRERLGRHPAAAAARDRLVEAIDEFAADGGRPLALRRELLAGRRGVEATPVDDASAWPLGRVVQRGGRAAAEPVPPGQEPALVPLTLTTVERPPLPGLAVVYEPQQRRLLVRDGYGRPFGAPLELDVPRTGVLMPWGRAASAFEVAVLGSVIVARTANRLTAFDLAAEGTPGRPLWRHAATLPDAPDRVVGWGGVRAPRGGHVPLGLRISEPNDGGAGQGWLAGVDGILLHCGAAVTLLDPVTGATFWERHDLPDAHWIGDDVAVCGCTPQGSGSPVLAADDGRLLHTFDLPPRRQRLAVHGRRVVAVRLLDEEPGAPVAGRVRIELVDPLERRAVALGEFSGAARATVAEPGRLAVVEPGGDLSLFDLETGDLLFRRPLPDMPRRCEELHVRAWQDRYLVFVGAVDGPGDGAGADVAPIEQLIFAGDASPPLTGAVWALARDGGDLLWPVPATIERHCLQTSQPAALPVLLFCRQLHSRLDRDRPQFSLLCLDKRTGHALFEENRLAVRRPLPAGCEIEGDPDGHAISIREVGAGGRPLVLVFTGEPTAPRPPFQARVRPPAAGVDLDLDPGADADAP